jgi:hypothetical protein
MARKLHQTTADYVVIAISPALIMALVGSLVFFLLGVFYQGQFPERLYWVMACFVFAAVLIGRISIEEGFERAAPFGAALAIVVGIAANRFMDFQGGWIDHFSWLINWSLIALTWWCAHRLTWDCTVIDDDQDSSGEGLLQTAGLEKSATDDSDSANDRRLEGTTSREVPRGFWQRYVEHQRRPHAPGVWVVYFSLAALPLFGIGQWLIPESDTAGRRHAFWLLSVYVASGMGLLLTTSFLGLRRYLRQRRIEMPTLMANLWLGTGAIVIGILLVVAALLPRPSAEYAISQLPFTVGSPEQQRSKSPSVPREGTKDDEPGTAPEPQSQEDSEQEKTDDPDQAPSDDDKSSDDRGDHRDKKSASGSTKRTDEKGSATSKDDRQKKQAGGKGEQSSSRKGEKSDDKDKGKSQDKGQSKDNDEKSPSQAKAERSAKQNKSDPKSQQSKNDDIKRFTDSKSHPAAEEMKAVGEAAATVSGIFASVLQWAVYVVVALAALYACWRFRAEILAAWRSFLQELRDFWNRFFGVKRPRAASARDAGQLEIPPAPFSSYADPFATGIVGRYSMTEIVRYTFEAFEAWSREHGCPRQPDQTPHELARDVSKLNAFISADARNLAELYSRAAYARGELSPAAGDQLRELWRKMRQNMATAIPDESFPDVS